MTDSILVNKLRNRIVESLSPLIDNDYVYIDLPYHSNIGDALIWQGTEDFLTSLPHNCLYRCSYKSFQRKDLNREVIILMHGGGNFGDLYPAHQDFRNRIINEYPNNRIIILPQTVYYNGSRMLANDAITMRHHKNLYICARDQYSFDFLNRYRFGKNILLVPDMAYCIALNKYSKFVTPSSERVLLVKRVDKEKTDTDDVVPNMFRDVLDVKDWVGYETKSIDLDVLSDLIHSKKYAEADEFAINTYLPKRVEDGIKMISPYNRVYSNRLHGAILSVLLGKEVTIIDNSYGKNANYYDTWMKGIPTIHIHRVKHRYEYKRNFHLCVNWICAQLGYKL